MNYHPDVLAAHAEFGGDLQAMQALYDRPDHIARIAALEAQLAERVKVKPLDNATQQKLREALRFAASRSVLSSEDERRILSTLEATPPAPKVTDVEFRLLEVGETLQSDDEVADDNGKSWVPVDRWAVGTPYSRAFKSVRRPLTAAQEAGKP